METNNVATTPARGSGGPIDDRSSGLSEERRRELADFLRTRREKLKPEQVGIAQGSRRRTPGLRREEVAELAGVGTTWYTWLEQARDIQPSTEVLRRLGNALQLNPPEIRHLFTLAGKASPTDLESADETVSESLKRLLEEALQVPAVLVGSRWDVLMMNRPALELFPSLAAAEPEKRNWIYYVFCMPVPRQRLDNWEDNARRLVGEFRASVSDTLDNPWVREIVDRLKAESAEFERFWREHEVFDQATARVSVTLSENEKGGFERMILRPSECSRYRIIIFTPLS